MGSPPRASSPRHPKAQAENNGNNGHSPFGLGLSASVFRLRSFGFGLSGFFPFMTLKAFYQMDVFESENHDLEK